MRWWVKLKAIFRIIFSDDDQAEAGASDHKQQDVVPTVGSISTSTSFDEKYDVLAEYEEVVRNIKLGVQAQFVTGGAGTGKSTLVRHLTKTIAKSAVVAPTGVAALNVQGQTVHSFFGIPLHVINKRDAIEPSSEVLPVMQNMEVLIVDEVSMVTPDLVDAMDIALKKARRNENPFGGVPVVFVGDLFQLPPVITNKEEAIFYKTVYKSEYFYSAHVFENVEIKPVVLEHVFRQKDKAFVSDLNRVRVGECSADLLERINECYGRKHEHALTIVPTNRVAWSINRDRLNQLPGRLKRYHATMDGDYLDSKNYDAKIKHPAPEVLELKVGASVIFLKNKKPDWVNGTQGVVESLEDNVVNVRVYPSGVTMHVEPMKWEKIRYHFNRQEGTLEKVVIGTFTQFPLNLGWAITIHKSQGMTFEQVTIDMGTSGAFCQGQTYVALSRCASKEGMALKQPIRAKDIIVDGRIVEVYRRIKAKRKK